MNDPFSLEPATTSYTQIFGESVTRERPGIDEICARDADLRTREECARDDHNANVSARVQAAERHLEMLRATNWTGARELALKVAERELAEARAEAGRVFPNSVKVSP